MKKAYYIAKKDFFEYFIKPPTLSWGITFPIAFALSFLIRGKDLFFLAPGLITLASFFGTTSMASAAIVFERRMKEFERMIVAPLDYWEIVLGKMIGSFLFGMLTSIVTILFIIPLLGMYSLNLGILGIALVLSSLVFAAFGVYISMMINDPRNVMVILNSVRFPMMFLSGVFIPLNTYPFMLQIIAYALPLTYEIELLRWVLTNNSFLNPFITIFGSIIWILLFFVLSIWALKRRY
ncbi:MAG: ABC transporter permease [Candidatus Njordarchaeum guaymaensis]